MSQCSRAGQGDPGSRAPALLKLWSHQKTRLHNSVWGLEVTWKPDELIQLYLHFSEACRCRQHA